jgi:hypothetical protein
LGPVAQRRVEDVEVIGQHLSPLSRRPNKRPSAGWRRVCASE